MSPRFNSFSKPDQMVDAIMTDTAKRLTAAVQARGKASWLVSGGGTPKPLFAAISGLDLPWEKITIALVDERYVPEDHGRSNTAFVKNTLLQGRASAAEFLPLYHGMGLHQDAKKADADYQALGPVDCLLLGIGPDGHTASLFPDADGLEEAFNTDNPALVGAIVAQKSDVTGDEIERLTVTQKLLAAVDHVDLMITGAGKKAVFDAAMQPGSALPIARVMRGLARPLGVYWAA